VRHPEVVIHPLFKLPEEIHNLCHGHFAHDLVVGVDLAYRTVFASLRGRKLGNVSSECDREVLELFALIGFIERVEVKLVVAESLPKSGLVEMRRKNVPWNVVGLVRQ
jgi:hypothetical protein